MSTEEREQFNAMAKELSIIKRWLPIFLGIGAIIGFSVKGTLWFDNNIAKKADTDAIQKEMKILNSRFDTVKATFVSYTQVADKIHSTQSGKIDSLGHIVALLQHGPVTSWRDEYGNTHFKTTN